MISRRRRPAMEAMAGYASETELADSGYGQGKILVNPIHLSSIYSALVNGGNMVKPYLLDGESATYWKEGVFTREAADTVLADLYQVVEDSSRYGPCGTAGCLPHGRKDRYGGIEDFEG